MMSGERQLALRAYGTTGGLAPSARELEARALLRTASLLQEAAERPMEPSRLFHALRENLRLWTVFRADAAASHNRLPEAMKRNVHDLASNVERLTRRALADTARPGVRLLADINRHVAQGLRPQSN